MKNTLLKRFSKFDFVFIIIFSAIISMLFICRGVSYIDKHYDLKQFYDDINYDFSIPAPSHIQLDELTQSSIIDIKVTPYYIVNSHLVNNNNNQKCNIYILKETDSDFLPYKSISFPKGGGVISRSLASKLNVRVGDFVYFQIKDNNVSVPILKIIQNIYEYNSVIDFCLIDESFVSNYSSNISYSGAWIKTDYISNTRNYLSNNYKPLGKLYKQSDYDSIEQYELHKKTILEGNYSKEILDIELMKHEVFSEENIIHKECIITIIGIFLLILLSVIPTIVEICFLNSAIIKRLINDGISKLVLKKMIKGILLLHFLVIFFESLLISIYYTISKSINYKFMLLTYILLIICWYLLKLICQVSLLSKIFKTNEKNNQFNTN